MGFSVGEFVVYGETGVCSVEEIAVKNMPGGEAECYKLKPVNQSCMIFTPVENSNVFMRPIISKQEAQALLDFLPGIEPVIHKGTSPRDLTEKYDKIIKSHDCLELAKLILSINEKRRILAEQKKKLSAIDERFLKKAEDLLFGELSAALSMEKSKVKELIKT